MLHQLQCGSMALCYTNCNVAVWCYATPIAMWQYDAMLHQLQCGSMTLCYTNCNVAVWRYATPIAMWQYDAMLHQLQVSFLSLSLIDCKARPSATSCLNYSIILTADRNFSPQCTKQCVIVCRFSAVRGATRRFGSIVVSSVHLLKPFAVMNHFSLQKVRSIPL